MVVASLVHVYIIKTSTELDENFLHVCMLNPQSQPGVLTL